MINGSEKDFTIPDSVTIIDDGAVAFSKNLKCVTIPDSVESIGSEAFAGCSCLTTVHMSNSVKKIGKWAFVACTFLDNETKERIRRVTHNDSVFYYG